MKHKCWLHLTSWGFVLLVVLGVSYFPVDAQEPKRWSPQARIPIYDDLIGEEPPLLVADLNRTVHAFNAQTLEDGLRAIVYRQWTLEQDWTAPIDIFLNASGGDIQVVDVLLDRSGIVHVALAMNGGIYYSQALYTHAGRASGWTAPELVGEQATIPYNAALAGDDNNNLAIIYAGGRDGRGLYAIYSGDGGATWSDLDIVFLTYDQERVVAGCRAYLGQSGQLHTVWNVFDEAGIGTSGHYARLDIEQRRWSDPIELDAAGIGLGIRTPAVVEYRGDVLVSYYNGNANANWWRRSRDAGQTWMEPVRLAPRHQGTNGAVSFVIDSNDVLHAFFGQRIDDLNHGMWHNVWNGTGWTELEAVVRGPQVRDRIGGKGFDPRSARAVISQGNVVLLAWATDGIAGENGAWYSYTVLDTPQLPAAALPALPVVPAGIPTPTITSSLSSAPVASSTRPISANYPSAQVAEVTGNPAAPVVIGLVPVALLVAGIIAAVRLQQYRRG